MAMTVERFSGSDEPYTGTGPSSLTAAPDTKNRLRIPRTVRNRAMKTRWWLPPAHLRRYRTRQL